MSWPSLLWLDLVISLGACPGHVSRGLSVSCVLGLDLIMCLGACVGYVSLGLAWSCFSGLDLVMFLGHVAWCLTLPRSLVFALVMSRQPLPVTGC